jgi:hypothetical protein
VRAAHNPSTEVLREIASLAPVAMRALDRDPDQRYPSGLEMAASLEAALPSASASEIGHWVERLGAERLAREHEIVLRIERAVATGEMSTTPVAGFRSWWMIGR